MSSSPEPTAQARLLRAAQDCKQQLGDNVILYATGQAGDEFLFDSNGAHRGNRRPAGTVRDTLFVEFSSDPSDIWGGDLPAGSCDESPGPAHDPFAKFKTAEKKWQRPISRKAPAWVENLPDVACWL